MDPRFPNLDEVLRTHEEIIQKTGGAAGVLQLGSLEAALDRARHGPFLHGGTIEERAALLLRGICQDHPFADGNKRTALAATDSFLHGNDFHLEAPTDEVVDFMLRVARVEEDVEGIMGWIRERLRKA